ncbi:MAG: DUF58 domain-containing protein [Clostridiales bacterium]|nr:DUF58 domain-containing protein [Clostridiales bacterium]
MFTRTNTALFLLCASVLTPCAALGLAMLAADKARIALRVPTGLRKGESAQCAVCIEIDAMFPFVYLAMTLSARNTLTGQKSLFPLIFPALRRGKREIRFIFSSAYCGQFIFSCEEFRVFDFLGLWGFRKQTEIQEKRVAPPDTFPLHVALSGGEAPPGGGEVFSVPRKGQDKTEPFQIRDYVEGDGIKQIHWKLTMKFGRYIVTDPSLEIERALLILWDGGQVPAYAPPSVPDALAESFASLCIALSEEDIPYSVGWIDGETGAAELKDVSSMDDIYDVIPGVMGARGTQTPTEDFLLALDGKKYPMVAYFSYLGPDDPEGLASIGRVTSFLCKYDGAGLDSTGRAASDIGMENSPGMGAAADAGKRGSPAAYAGASGFDGAAWQFTPQNYKSVLRDVHI